MEKVSVAILSLAILCLATFVILEIQPVKAQYQGNITINADGSITPKTAPIQQTGNRYIPTSDIDGNITVRKTNTIFDGNNHIIRGEVLVQSAFSAVIKNCIITDTAVGLKLLDCTFVQVVNNTITKTGKNSTGYAPFQSNAIFVFGGHSNVLVGNNLIDNHDGICLSNTKNNLIISNNIIGTKSLSWYFSYGLSLYQSANNSIYHSNFINNTIQTNIRDWFNSNVPSNTWDNGQAEGGNFWSDYWPHLEEFRKTHPRAESIYWLNKVNIDGHPLMRPFDITNYLLELPTLKLSITSPDVQTYKTSSVPIIFGYDYLADQIIYSLDGIKNITLNGNSTLTELANGKHNITIYAKDAFGHMVTSETISFTIAVPLVFPITIVVLCLSMLLIAISVAIYIKKNQPRAAKLSQI